MTGSGTAEQWRRTLEGVTRLSFVTTHPYAFLVWAPNLTGDVTPPAASLPLGFHTQVHGT
ncbi:MAG: hypothetical protein RLZZ450_6074, partial [Pseudomonadota bacterium]